MDLKQKIAEAYRDYHNNRTGFARPKREDDEYVNGPDRMTHKTAFTVTHPDHNEGKPHRREVTTTNSTKTKQQAAMAARQHLEGKGFKIQEEVVMAEGYNDIGPHKEAMDKEHPIAKEYDAMKQHDIKTLRNMIKGQHKIIDTSEYRTKDHAISAYLRHKHGDKKVAAAMGLKEAETDTRIWEAWGMGKRDPQKGIKVGQQVRSYDFPGMHDDHYIEGHVVGETPHSYHIRTSRVVRGGKEVPIPAHMGHVEAPKGRGMFSDAYAVHKIVAKQDSVAAQPEPAKGGARTFAAMRGKR